MYAGEGQELNILLIGDRLYAKLGSKPPFEIYAEDKLRFYAKKVNVVFTFNAGPNGQISQLATKIGNEVHYFNKKGS